MLICVCYKNTISWDIEFSVFNLLQVFYVLRYIHEDLSQQPWVFNTAIPVLHGNTNLASRKLESFHSFILAKGPE